MTWATTVPILAFLGLSVLDLGPMYATYVRQTDRRQTKHRLMPPPIRGGHNNSSTARCAPLHIFSGDNLWTETL